MLPARMDGEEAGLPAALRARDCRGDMASRAQALSDRLVGGKKEVKVLWKLYIAVYSQCPDGPVSFSLEPCCRLKLTLWLFV